MEGTSDQVFIVLPIVILFVASYVCPILHRVDRRGLHPFAVGSVLLSFLATLRLLHLTGEGGECVYRVGGWEAPWGIELVADPLGAYLSSIISGVSLLVFLGSDCQIRQQIAPQSTGWFYAAALSAVGASVGMVLTRDLFNLFVLVEITAISGCALVSIRGGARSTEAAFKYLLLTAVGSSMILLSIAYLYMFTGNLNMVYVALELSESTRGHADLIPIALGLFTVGMLIKAALFPLHVWLPDAYSFAPSPSAALLAGALSKAYVGGLLRVYTTIYSPLQAGQSATLGLVRVAAATGIVVIAFVLVWQFDLRRLLAYSSVVHTGYIFLGLGLVSSTAVTGAFLHMLNHSIVQSALFLVVGRVGAEGPRSLERVSGLLRRDVAAGALFIVASLSMVGVPVLNGFVSKWRLFLGTVESGFTAYAGVLVVGTLLSVLYYGRVLVRCLDQSHVPGDSRGSPETVVILLFILVIFVLGIYPGPALGYLEESGLVNLMK